MNLKKLVLLLFAAFISIVSAYAAEEEIIFHMENQRSIMDIYTDPESRVWERYVPLNDICYKNANAEQALAEIFRLRDLEILMHDWQTEGYRDHYFDGPIIYIVVFNEKKLDDGIEEEEAIDEHAIGPCEF